jgi:hypothetical protein
MNTQLKKLNELNIDLDHFYNVDLTKNTISLQGKSNYYTTLIAKKIGIELAYDNETQWLSGKKNGVCITLTCND